MATKQDLRNLLRKARDDDNRQVARIMDKAILRALGHFRLCDIKKHYGVSVHTINRYRLRILFSEPLPSVQPPPVDWIAVDDEIRMGWHLEELARSIGPEYIVRQFGVTPWQARRAGEPVEGCNVMAGADPELREAVIQARNEYKATKAKRRLFTYPAIAERHGTSQSTISIRARELRAAEQQDMEKVA